MTPPEHSIARRLSRKHRTFRRHIEGVSRRTILLVVLVVGLGALTVITGPALSQSGASSTPATEANNSTAAPGTEVVSAVSIEGILLSGDLQRRTLDVELTRATSDEERATIVATTISSLNSRLDSLEERAQRLQNARQASRMSAAAFHVNYAPIAAEARMIDRTLGRLQTAATKLPASRYEAQYTNTTSIDRLDERASGLTDAENSTFPGSVSTPTPTPTPTATPTPTPTATPTPTPTATPTSTTTAVTEIPTTAEGTTTTDRPTPSTETTGTDSNGPNNDDGGNGGDGGNDDGSDGDSGDGNSDDSDDGNGGDDSDDSADEDKE